MVLDERVDSLLRCRSLYRGSIFLRFLPIKSRRMVQLRVVKLHPISVMIRLSEVELDHPDVDMRLVHPLLVSRCGCFARLNEAEQLRLRYFSLWRSREVELLGKRRMILLLPLDLLQHFDLALLVRNRLLEHHFLEDLKHQAMTV